MAVMSGTLFKQVQYSLSKLVEDIEMGEIGLPDIQRPFVWKNWQVRDLFDSMYKGFPVGYLLFWTNSVGSGFRQVGLNTKQKVPHLLIVDGQQRLTSLFAVLKGIPVVREDYSMERIFIAFRPTDCTFEVTDAAIRKNPEFVEDISAIWDGRSTRTKFVRGFIDRLKKHREVLDVEEEQITESLDQLYDLQHYPFTTMELSASMDEERVAEVFVRINSKGKVLNQADFILTLMSVFWDEGRTELENFCRSSRVPEHGKPSAFNHFIHPDPDQLLRTSIAVGFRRARLKYAYLILRGKDLETQEFSDDRRIRQFEVLEKSQAEVLNLDHWHEYFNAVRSAGFLGEAMIMSNMAMVYCYALFLIGRVSLRVEPYSLRWVIARWFFMSQLTGRYTGSPESAMEQDLQRLREVRSATDFISTLDQIVRETFTEDYWRITLPSQLESSAARLPALMSYYSSLALLNAKVLFSNQLVKDLLDPAIRGHRVPIERHHLFPKAHLNRLGFSELHETNQAANFALVEWPDNTDIGDTPPAEYLPVMEGRLEGEELVRMRHWHALPEGWHELDYPVFLDRRRKLMAAVIREGVNTLWRSAPGFTE